jgi:hypothetical protein
MYDAWTIAFLLSAWLMIELNTLNPRTNIVYFSVKMLNNFWVISIRTFSWRHTQHLHVQLSDGVCAHVVALKPQVIKIWWRLLYRPQLTRPFFAYKVYDVCFGHEGFQSGAIAQWHNWSKQYCGPNNSNLLATATFDALFFSTDPDTTAQFRENCSFIGSRRCASSHLIYFGKIRTAHKCLQCIMLLGDCNDDKKAQHPHSAWKAIVLSSRDSTLEEYISSRRLGGPKASRKSCVICPRPGENVHCVG